MRIAAIRIYLEVFNLFYKLVLAEKLRGQKQNGVEYIECDLSSLKFLSDDFSYEFVEFGTKDFSVGLKQKLKSKLKSILNSPKSSDYVLCVQPNSTTIKLLDNKFKNYRMVYPWLFLKRRFQNSDKSFPLSSGIVHDLCERYKELTNCELPLVIKNSFSKALDNHFNQINFDLDQAVQFVNKNKFHGALLVRGTGVAYPTAVFSEAVRKTGGKVLGTPHGGGLSGSCFADLVWSEFLTCDKFACFSKKEFKDYQKATLPEFNIVEFPFFPDVEESVLDVEAFDYNSFDFNKVGTFMHVSSGAFHDHYYHGVAADLQHFNLQIKIIEFFQKFNKKYIFKARTKTNINGKGFNHLGYFNSKVEYSSKPFTEVVHQADLFIFEMIGSSALWEAMTLTDKPIILFNPLIDNYESFDDSIRKRCLVIDQYLDKHNRLCFDESLLSSKLGLDTVLK